MSTQCKSEFANRIANLGWNLDATLALARYPRICSLCVRTKVKGVIWWIFDSHKQLKTSSGFVGRVELSHWSFQVPKDWNARLLFLAVEYIEIDDYVPKTAVEVVCDDKRVNKFTLEEHSQARSIPNVTNGDYSRIINYCPICARGLTVPDIIYNKPLQIIESGFSREDLVG